MHLLRRWLDMPAFARLGTVVAPGVAMGVALVTAARIVDEMALAGRRAAALAAAREHNQHNGAKRPSNFESLQNVNMKNIRIQN